MGLAGITEITNVDSPVKVVLKKAATITGQVTDPDNKPINLARIRVSFKIPHYLPAVDNYIYTDNNGRFELKAVPYEQKNFGHRTPKAQRPKGSARSKGSDQRGVYESVTYDLPEQRGKKGNLGNGRLNP